MARGEKRLNGELQHWEGGALANARWVCTPGHGGSNGLAGAPPHGPLWPSTTGNPTEGTHAQLTSMGKQCH